MNIIFQKGNKKMKKLLAILLTFAMVFSLASVSVFAANEGKITITTRNAGTEYNIYKILDVDSTTADHSLVTYKVADKWAGFFKTTMFPSTRMAQLQQNPPLHRQQHRNLQPLLWHMQKQTALHLTVQRQQTVQMMLFLTRSHSVTTL